MRNCVAFHLYTTPMPLLFIIHKMDLRWKHPFTAIISGPTSSGKSFFIKRFLEDRHQLISPKIEDVIYCVPEGQKADASIPFTHLHEGIPDSDSFKDGRPRLIILDDLMREANGNVIDLFTKGSHHQNISVMFVTQNFFNQGKGRRDISLNAHYIVCLKNPRDRQQIRYLARQIYPENPDFIQEAYNDATSMPYGYLLFDLTQTTPDKYRYRTSIFPSDIPQNIIYVQKRK